MSLLNVAPEAMLRSSKQATQSVALRVTGALGLRSFFGPSKSTPLKPGQPGTSTDADGRVRHVVTKTVAFPPSFMCEIAADVANYRRFLPFCSDSIVKPATEQFVNDVHAHPHPIPALASAGLAPKRLSGPARMFEADLVIGYGAFSLTYASLVTVQHPQRVLSEALPSHSSVFSHLVSQWEFAAPSSAPTDAALGEPVQCSILFTVDFKVSNPMYSTVVRSVFSDIATRQLDAFVKRATGIYPSWRSATLRTRARTASTAASPSTSPASVGSVLSVAAAPVSASVPLGSADEPWGLALWRRRVSFPDDHLVRLVHAALVAAGVTDPASPPSLSVAQLSSVLVPLRDALQPSPTDAAGLSAAAAVAAVRLTQTQFTAFVTQLAAAGAATVSPAAEPPVFRRFRDRYILKAAAESPAVARALWTFVIALSGSAPGSAPSSVTGSMAGAEPSMRLGDAVAALHAVTRANSLERVMNIYLSLPSRNGSAAATEAEVVDAVRRLVTLSVATVRHVVPRMVLRRAQSLKTAAAEAAAAAGPLATADASAFALGDGDASARAWAAAAAPAAAPRVVEALSLMGEVVGEAAAAADALPGLVWGALPAAAADGTKTFTEDAWAAAWAQPRAAEVAETLSLQGVEGLVDWALAQTAAGAADTNTDADAL